MVDFGQRILAISVIALETSLASKVDRQECHFQSSEAVVPWQTHILAFDYPYYFNFSHNRVLTNLT